MAHAHVAKLHREKLDIGPVAMRLGVPGLLIGIIALAFAVWLGFANPDMISHFFHSYLAAYAFYMAMTLGSIFFVMVHHLARAGWSVAVRRLAEGLMQNIFLMVLLALPFFITLSDGSSGLKILFEWLHPDAFARDTILQSKQGYMNPTFFGVRMAIYFAFWCFLAWFYPTKSLQQDESGDYRISIKLEWFAAPCMILFGFSLTAFAFDWIMALNPHWFSTIFGVYYFAGCFLSAIALIILLSLALQKRGLIGNTINHEHYHDLGKWMFAFTFFWGYIAFAQYMLIWYANLPEETQFYIPRTIGYWGSVSLFLLFVHLLIPFPGLLSRHVKRKNSVLAFWAVWTLCACAIDQYWLIIPNQWINRIPAEVGNREMPLQNAFSHLLSPHNIYQVNDAHQSFVKTINFPLQPVAILVTALCFIGLGGLYLFSTMMALRNKPLVPLQDPRLQESLAFENV